MQKALVEYALDYYLRVEIIIWKFSLSNKLHFGGMAAMKNRQIYTKLGICLALVFLIVTMIINFFNNKEVEEISYAEARQMISSLEVTNVDLSKETQIATLYSDDSDIIYQVKIPNIEAFCAYMEDILEEHNKVLDDTKEIIIDFNVKENNSFFETFGSLLVSLLPTVLSISLTIYFIKRMFKNSPVKVFGEKDEPIKPAVIQNVTFEDVAGIDKELADIAVSTIHSKFIDR